MQQTYQTKATLDTELRVYEILKERGFECRKLPRWARLDAVVLKDGKAVTLVEVKGANFRSDKLPIYSIATKKVKAARELTHAFRIPAVLIVVYEDKMRKISFAENHTTRMGGRTDRNDPEDIEEMAVFRCDRFEDF